MEQFIWVSFAIGLLALIQCSINYQGGYYNCPDDKDCRKSYQSSLNREEKSFLGTMNYITLSNFHGYSNYTTDKRALNWVSESSTAQITYMLVDTCIILVLIGWIFFFKVYSGLISTHAKQERVCASMYAVEVHGLPIYRE